MELVFGSKFSTLHNDQLLTVEGGGWLATTVTVVGLAAATVGLAMAIAACPAVAIVAAPSLAYSVSSISLVLGGSITAGAGSMFL